MTHSWYWIITGLSIVGVILNIHKRPEGFAVWIVTNSCWMAIDWHKGIYPQAALFAVYLVLSVWGLIRWKRR